MPRPNSGKPTIKGTRNADAIAVGADGVTVNGVLKAYDSATIDAGLIIKADAGDDVVSGGSGPDTIDGGSGNDVISGGGGFDTLLGGAGNDRLSDTYLGATFDGGRGYDILDFSNSPTAVAISVDGNVASTFSYDTVDGHPILDVLFDIGGRVLNVEELIGGDFNDVLWGSRNADVIRGGGGNDYLVGSDLVPGSDQLFGDAGNDVLVGGRGDDQLTGGDGGDTFLFGDDPSSIEGHDVIFDYGAGDLLAFQYATSGPTWAEGDYLGTPSLVGTYDGGLSSVTLVGVTDINLVMVQLSSGQW